MLSLLRRRTAAILAGTTFCDSCGEVCTAACRARTRHDRVLTRVHSYPVATR